MADFILPVNEAGNITLRRNDGADNAGIAFRAHSAYEDVATVTAEGVITPIRTGSMLIEVIDLTDGSVMAEMTGVIVTPNRFLRLRQLRQGEETQEIEVVGATSNINLGPGLFGTLHVGG